MSDPCKTVAALTEAKFAAAFSDSAAMLMAEHCDRRIDTVRYAVDEEEAYLLKLLHSEENGPVMQGDIEGAFHRIREALDRNPFTEERRA